MCCSALHSFCFASFFAVPSQQSTTCIRDQTLVLLCALICRGLSISSSSLPTLIVLFILFARRFHLIHLPCACTYTCLWSALNCATVRNYGGLDCSKTSYAWSKFSAELLNLSFAIISWTTNPGFIPFIFCLLCIGWNF